MTNEEIKKTSIEELEEEEVAKKIKERIAQINKENFDIELCIGKGITLDKMTEIGNRQQEIEAELSTLKTKKNKKLSNS